MANAKTKDGFLRWAWEMGKKAFEDGTGRNAYTDLGFSGGRATILDVFYTANQRTLRSRFHHQLTSQWTAGWDIAKSEAEKAKVPPVGQLQFAF